MDEESTIRRSPHDTENPYVMIRRDIFQGSGLSFEAKGLLGYLLSKPDDWKIMISDLMREGDCGRDQIRRILKELKDHGYIITQQTHDNNDGARFGKTEYWVCESPLTGNPSTGNPSTENPQLLNKEETEEREDNGSPPLARRSASPLRVPPGANRVDVISPSEPKKHYGKSDDDMPVAGRIILEELNGSKLTAKQIDQLRARVVINEKTHPSPSELATKNEKRFREYVQHIKTWMGKNAIVPRTSSLISYVCQYGAQYRGWFDFDGQKTVDGQAIPKSAPAYEGTGDWKGPRDVPFVNLATQGEQS